MPSIQLDKVRLSCLDQGEGDDLLLIHGVGSNKESWDTVAEELESSYRVIRYDLRGHGRSEKVAGPYSMNQFCKDAVGILDSLAVEKASVIGFSLGGLIAQSLLLNFPHRIERAVLVSTTANRSQDESEAARDRANRLQRGEQGGHIDTALKRWFTDEFRLNNPRIIESIIQRGAANDPACYAAAYQVLAKSDFGDQLYRISTPTLVITGEHDVNSTAAMANFMASTIPGASLEIYEGLKHGLLAECPQRLAGSIKQFLEQK